MYKQFLAIALFVGGSMFAVAQEPTAIPAEHARKFAERLVAAAAKLDVHQVTIDPDVMQANGIHVPGKLGLMIVPQKGLKEGEELAARFRTEKGAPLGYMFALNAVPVVNGQRIEASRLRKISITDDSGTERSLYVSELAVRQLSESDYRLYVYGAGKEPLFDTKFAEGSANGAETVTITVKDGNEQTKEGTVVITAFGKYQTEFRGAQEN